MESLLIAFAAALAIGLPAVATAWAQSKIGAAGAGSLAEKPELSGTIIILVAILEKQSKLIAAITATMPITVSLGLWVVYASEEGNQEAMNAITSGLIIGIIPSVIFLISVWIGSRFGLRLVPLLITGYLSWGLALGVILILRRLLGL